MIFKILTVTAISSFEIYAAIGTAHAFGLSAWVILGCTLTNQKRALVILFGKGMAYMDLGCLELFYWALLLQSE